MGLMCFVLAGAAVCGSPVGDESLARARGGFSLPNGIDVALSIDTQTAVNGAVVLRSVLRIDRGPAQITAYVPRAGQSVAETPNGSAPGGGVTVRYGAGRSGIDPAAAGLVRSEAGAVTDNGVLVIGRSGGIQTAGLRGPALDITHLAGNAIGSAIANSAGDRTIDTRTVVSIDLSHAGPDVLGSAMLRAQSLGSDIVAGRVH